jgi:hypothetical protein
VKEGGFEGSIAHHLRDIPDEAMRVYRQDIGTGEHITLACPQKSNYIVPLLSLPDMGTVQMLAKFQLDELEWTRYYFKNLLGHSIRRDIVAS